MGVEGEEGEVGEEGEDGEGGGSAKGFGIKEYSSVIEKLE